MTPLKFDPSAHIKLDRLLAGHEGQAAKLEEIEAVLRMVITTVHAHTAALGIVNQHLDVLADAINEPPSDDGLVTTMRAIHAELERQTGHMALITDGLERLPAIMEDTAIAAVHFAAQGVLHDDAVDADGEDAGAAERRAG
jgi:hypothetical protein